MPALDSKLDPGSASFLANAQRMQERLAEVQRLEGLVIAESESKRKRFEERGQLLPRERVARLLDRGSGFLELSRLAGLNMHDDDGKKSGLGGGSIVGIGTVAGKRVLISASDSGVKGGTVHGRWPGLARERLYEGRDLALTTDFRTVFSELATAHLGATRTDALFPGFDGAKSLGLLR